MMFHPCFLAVDRAERITAKSLAPSSERKPPEIFCRSFIIRPSRSARLLVNGTADWRGSGVHSCLWVRKRSSKLWPTRRGGRPRGLVLVSAGCASWNAGHERQWHPHNPVRSGQSAQASAAHPARVRGFTTWQARRNSRCIRRASPPSRSRPGPSVHASGARCTAHAARRSEV